MLLLHAASQGSSPQLTSSSMSSQSFSFSNATGNSLKGNLKTPGSAGNGKSGKRVAFVLADDDSDVTIKDKTYGVSNFDSGETLNSKDDLGNDSAGKSSGSFDSVWDKYKPKKGSWKCAACMVMNDPSATKCVSCETPAPAKASMKEIPSKQPKAASAQPAFSFSAPSSSSAIGNSDIPAFTFGSSGSSNIESAAQVGSSGKTTTFSFGAAGDKVADVGSSESSTAGSSSSGSSNAGFTFGATDSSAVTTKNPSASTSNAGDSKAGFSFGTSDNKSTSGASFSFGAVKPESGEHKPSDTPVENKTGFSFSGNVNSTPTAASSSFSFGATGGAKKGDEAPDSTATSGFSFGQPTVKAASDEVKSGSGSSKTAGFTFGGANASSGGSSGSAGFSLGSSSAKTPKEDDKPAGFSFGAQAAPGDEAGAAAASFSFNSGKNDESSSSKESAPSFAFGSTSNKPAATLGETSAPVPTFAFGSSSTEANSKAQSAELGTLNRVRKRMGQDTSELAGTPSSGSQAAAGFTFGEQSKLEVVKKRMKGEGFGGGSNSQDGSSNLLTKVQERQSKPFSFGQTGSKPESAATSTGEKPAFSFGSTPADKSAASTALSFGGTSTPANIPATTNSQTDSAPFAFGSATTNTAPSAISAQGVGGGAAGASTGFSFGGNASSSSVAATATASSSSLPATGASTVATPAPGFNF